MRTAEVHLIRQVSNVSKCQKTLCHRAFILKFLGQSVLGTL